MNAEELKEKGNACVKEGKHHEAVIYYSQAISSDPNNSILFSNRSLAFLKIQQFYHAYSDAKKAIDLKPDWAKGYFRKAEVEMATFHFEKALTSYTKAFCLQKDDHSLMDCMKKAARELKKDQKAEKDIPWLGAGVGIIIGVIIVLADYLVADKSVLAHPALKVAITMAMSLLAFGFCKAYRFYVKSQREAMLQPPYDLSGDKENPDNSHEETSDGTATKSDAKDPPKKFSKAQARHRFKKGKAN